MEPTYRGSCLCGRVRFEIEGGFDAFYLCYCGHCRKDTGSAHASNLFSRSAKLTWLQGLENVKTHQLNDREHVKSFCSNCGSALPAYSERLKLLVVPAGSLDTEPELKPDARIFLDSKAGWVEGLDNIPGFGALPESNQ